MRLHHDMNVVRHDYPGEQIVALSHLLAMLNSFHNAFRDLGITEPSRTALNWRYCPGQSPRHKEDGIVRNPMRKFPLPEHRNRRKPAARPPVLPTGRKPAARPPVLPTRRKPAARPPVLPTRRKPAARPPVLPVKRKPAGRNRRQDRRRYLSGSASADFSGSAP
jgi:hypothetical protein